MAAAAATRRTPICTSRFSKTVCACPCRASTTGGITGFACTGSTFGSLRVNYALGGTATNGSGAEVTGRAILTGPTRVEIDLNYALNYLLALRDGIEPPASLADKGFDWQGGWSDAWTSTDEGRSYKDTLHHYFVRLNSDGTFHISGLPRGEYELALKLYEPPHTGCLIQPIAARHVRFEVTGAHAREGLDLGEIETEAFLGPMPGEPAPDFTFAATDGTERSLSDYRGKYVLIDVWATWCGPCVAITSALQQSDDGRFMMVWHVVIVSHRRRFRIAIVADPKKSSPSPSTPPTASLSQFPKQFPKLAVIIDNHPPPLMTKGCAAKAGPHSG